MTSDGGGPSIAAVETAVVTAHAKPGLRVRGARVVHDTSSFVLVRVITDEGVEGYGEISATAAWSGEDHVTATHFVRDVFAPLLLGAPLAPVDRHGVELDRVVRGNWFTKAGVDTALRDALGRTARHSPWRRCSEGRSGSEVPTKISLSGDGDDLREGYATAAALGFQAFKVKVGRDPDTDVARVRLARELVGDGALLGVDANGGWSRAVALATVPRLAELGIAFVEQPVAADDLEGMRRCARWAFPSSRTSRSTPPPTWSGSSAREPPMWSASTSARAQGCSGRLTPPGSPRASGPAS